jgi:hypothetical protein
MTVGLFLSVSLAACGDDDFTVPDGGTATPRDLSVIMDARDGGDLSVTDANADANPDLTGVDLSTPDLTGVDLSM